MPDLGKYAVDVLAAYAGSLALIGGIVGASLIRAGRVRRRLEAAEDRRRDA